MFNKLVSDLRIKVAVFVALGLLTFSPALAAAQVPNNFDQAMPASGNMMYSAEGTTLKTMPNFQTQNSKGQITFSSPMMQYRNFGQFRENHFSELCMLAFGITLLMLWVLMALAIVWLASHLKKNLHKKD